MDLAIGCGKDLPHWDKARCSYLVGLTTDECCTNECRDRAQSMCPLRCIVWRKSKMWNMDGLPHNHCLQTASLFSPIFLAFSTKFDASLLTVFPPGKDQYALL